MSAPDFLDTNVLVYAYDTSYPEKQKIARVDLDPARAQGEELAHQPPDAAKQQRHHVERAGDENHGRT